MFPVSQNEYRDIFVDFLSLIDWDFFFSYWSFVYFVYLFLQFLCFFDVGFAFVCFKERERTC